MYYQNLINDNTTFSPLLLPIEAFLPASLFVLSLILKDDELKGVFYLVLFSSPFTTLLPSLHHRTVSLRSLMTGSSLLHKRYDVEDT